jgi:hypothetical protein
MLFIKTLFWIFRTAGFRRWTSSASYSKELSLIRILIMPYYSRTHSDYGSLIFDILKYVKLKFPLTIFPSILVTETSQGNPG